MRRARENVPAVVRALMRVEGVNQATLGAALRLGQRDVSYRLTHPQAISVDELAGIAAYFGIEVTTLLKPEREALADYFLSTRAKGALLCSAAA